MNTQIITPAATVLIIRDGQKGIEVFMVERSNRPPFGNLFVFPGGKIDQSDNDPRAQSICRSILDEEASSLLGIEKNGLGYWIACVSCLLYTSPSPRDATLSRMPSSA